MLRKKIWEDSAPSAAHICVPDLIHITDRRTKEVNHETVDEKGT
jgi:hypothetical protein